MYLKILEYGFVVICAVLTLLLVLREFGITKKMSGMKASDYISAVAVFLFGYIIFAFLLAIFLPNIIQKTVMLVLGFSPFIIGRLASYQKLKVYSIIQILIILLSGIYFLLI